MFEALSSMSCLQSLDFDNGKNLDRQVAYHLAQYLGSASTLRQLSANVGYNNSDAAAETVLKEG